MAGTWFLVHWEISQDSTNHQMKMEVLYAAMLLLWAIDADSRLILTPFIETGKIPEGRNLSAVHGGPFPANVTSHSGFFTKNWQEAPVLLWLQGGPGTSSLFGLFNGVGPFTLSEDGELLRNAYSWHKKFSENTCQPLLTPFTATTKQRKSLSTSRVGLIDSKTYDAIKEQEETGKRLIKSEKFLEAFNNKTERRYFNCDQSRCGPRCFCAFFWCGGLRPPKITVVSQVDEARRLAAVSGGPFFEDIPSYSGFFTQGYESAPLLLWLQGGPGSSSLYGLFTELGPFTLDYDDVTLVKNPYSWHRNHSIIFIDNPCCYHYVLKFFFCANVLNGFSFTDADAGYATEQVQVGAELYSAITQFLTVFPELQKVPFYITGESYAGIAVGNGFTDPITILDYSDFVYQLGYYNIYNFLYWMEPQVGGDYFTFLQTDEVRIALHVGDAEYTSNGPVYAKMIPDFMNSVKPWLEELIEHYRVLYYNGQMDIIVAYPLSVRMFNTLQFGAAEEYRNATRVPWYVDGELAGYMKSAGKFTEVLVRNAGHMVPTDQPKWAFDLINRFTNDDLFGAAEEYRNAKRVPWYVDGELAGYMKSAGKFTEVLQEICKICNLNLRKLGPFTVAEDDVTLVRNPYSWHRNHSLIFFDNPVGTGSQSVGPSQRWPLLRGHPQLLRILHRKQDLQLQPLLLVLPGRGFSFTDFNEGYATEQTQIGAELYIALLQFLKIFPELQNAPLYLSGESYAGKSLIE
ncbi:hypothetical protein C0J52_26170 [Blattella germanica]|nr:hypothetical protein C0J52_26170 [Blattella germanica]